VIIPADTEGRRDGLLERVRAHVAGVLPEAEVLVVRGPVDPYCKAEVCNRGAKEANGDVLIFIDSDMLHNPNVLRRAATVKCWGVSSAEVRNLLPGKAPGGKCKVRPGKIKGRGGLFAFTREAWETVGGFDEGFVGWGMQDMALYVTASRLLGEPEELGAEPAYHLHHKCQPDRAKVRAKANHPNRRRLAALESKGDKMRLRITNESRNVITRGGYVLRPGQTIETEVTSDYRLRELRACSKLSIICLDEAQGPSGPTGPVCTGAQGIQGSSEVEVDADPLFECPCGFRAKSKAGLKAHQRRCLK
jgi:hypothetical protein